MKYLIQVVFTLPKTNKGFVDVFLSYLQGLGRVGEDQITLRTSRQDYLPETRFQFTDMRVPQVSFYFSDNSSFSLNITNTTNVSKKSPYSYSHIFIDDFIKRITKYSLKGIDHIGFNLPYFDGIHPTILELREKLKPTCLYHTFPKHLIDAPWDFIIPGTENEVNSIVF